MLVYRPGLNTSRIVIQDRRSFFLVLNKSELVTPYFRHVEEPCREFLHLLGVQQLLPIVAKKVTAMVQEITAVESHHRGRARLLAATKTLALAPSQNASHAERSHSHRGFSPVTADLNMTENRFNGFGSQRSRETDETVPDRFLESLSPG